MKRVLYFTGNQMAAQEWLGNTLESTVYFELNQHGLDLFSVYLRSFQNEPVRLLVDLIEEEFRQIKIPLLRGSDRQSIISRKYLKYFSHSKYRFSISQSIEKKKRREEKLLLIGLTNEYLLEPWLKIIEETHTPLSGIISLPLLSVDYTKSLKSKRKAVILVSQQVPNSLRQSVFIDGKLILSRMSPITSFYEGEYGNDVIHDIENTQRYLIGQHIVERSQVVDVHILTNKRHLDTLNTRCAGIISFDFKILEINELLENKKIKTPEEQDLSSALFCNLATKKTVLNHYAQAKEKWYYQHHIASIGLKICSVAILAVGFGLAMNSGVKGWLYSTTTTDTVQIEKKYRAKYNQLSEKTIYSSMSTHGTSTNSMKRIVQTVDEIQNNYLNDPQAILIQVSQDISSFSNLRVTKMNWFVSNYADTKDVSEVHWSNLKSGKRQAENLNIPLTKGLFEIAVVEAEFSNFDGNYRYALSATDDLEKSMSELGKYTHVEILKRPLNIEPENSLMGEAGKNRRNAMPLALLTFRVVREIKNEK
jgi:hypothetical protein